MKSHILIKPDFVSYLSSFIEDMSDGKRQTVYGKGYSVSSIEAAKQTLRLLILFQDESSFRLRFKDIDMNFYRNFIQFLYNKDYSINSIGKYLHIIKATLSFAKSEGIHTNTTYLDKKFKAPHCESEDIYLTMEDLEKFSSANLSALSQCYEKARDVFLVGVWTAQRVSDYSNIKKDNIHYDGDFTTIQLTQKKTGKHIIIPCSSSLIAILDKYGGNLPHIWPQHLNRYIKRIGEIAGLDEPVIVKSTKGGKVTTKTAPKYSQIKTHTARRTGATLMYLAGVDVWDIMQITGHSSPTMLKKYIKADKLEIARKIKRKYSYFK